MGITVGGLDFNHAFADFQNRDIESSATEVVHRNGLVLALVEPVGQRRRRRLIDDALHFEAGNLTGIFGGLSLRVIEIRRHSDDRFGHLLAEVVLRRLLQLLQDQRGNLRWGVLLALRHDHHVVSVALHFVRDHL